MRSQQKLFDGDIFAQRLKARIRELSLKQGELANKTGIGQSTISRYVNNKQAPELAPAVALASALKCDLGWLVGIDEISKKDKDEKNRTWLDLPPQDHPLKRGERRLLEDALEILRAEGPAAEFGKTLKQTIKSCKQGVLAQKKIVEPSSKKAKAN
jgi:transcriptional regulator with XRE-family HTH domain